MVGRPVASRGQRASTRSATYRAYALRAGLALSGASFTSTIPAPSTGSPTAWIFAAGPASLIVTGHFGSNQSLRPNSQLQASMTAGRAR